MSSDYQLEDTLYLPFTTRAFATGVPTTLVGGAIDIYENATGTPMVVGESLAVDVNTIAGLNLIQVTATSGTGFQAGAGYYAILQAGTVGGVSVVGEVVAQWTIEKSAVVNLFTGITSVAEWLGLIAGKQAGDATAITEIKATGAGSGTYDPTTDSTEALRDHIGNGTSLTEAGGTGDQLTAINLPNQTMDITGSLSGSVGSVSGAVGSVGAGGITAASIADAAIDNATFAADVGSTAYATNILALAADKAIVERKLDHLVAVADADDVVNDSIMAKLAATAGDWSTFVEGTDSLQAIRDRGDAAWTTGAGGSDRLLMVDTTIASLTSQTQFILTAGSADADAYNNCTIVIEDASTAVQKCVGIVSNYIVTTKEVFLKYDPGIFTMAPTDKVYILAENALKSTAANRQLDVTATGAAGIDWGNVENKTTANDLTQTDIQLCDTTTTNSDMVGTDSAALASVCTEGRLAELDAGNLPTDIAAIPTTAMRGTDSAALASVCTEGRLAELDAGNLPTDIAAVKTDTAEIGSGVALDGGSATIAGMLTKLADDGGGAVFDAGTDSLEKIRDHIGDGTTLTEAGGTGDQFTNLSTQASVDAVKGVVDATLVDTGTTLPAQISTTGIQKNVARNNFEFLMVTTSTGAPAAGATVLGQRSIDGAAFAGVTGAIANVGVGIYQFDAAQADTNGDVITWRFYETATGLLDDTFFTFRTVT